MTKSTFSLSVDESKIMNQFVVGMLSFIALLCIVHEIIGLLSVAEELTRESYRGKFVVRSAGEKANVGAGFKPALNVLWENQPAIFSRIPA